MVFVSKQREKGTNPVHLRKVRIMVLIILKTQDVSTSASSLLAVDIGWIWTSIAGLLYVRKCLQFEATQCTPCRSIQAPTNPLNDMSMTQYVCVKHALSQQKHMCWMLGLFNSIDISFCLLKRLFLLFPPDFLFFVPFMHIFVQTIYFKEKVEGSDKEWV